MNSNPPASPRPRPWQRPRRSRTTRSPGTRAHGPEPSAKLFCSEASSDRLTEAENTDSPCHGPDPGRPDLYDRDGRVRVGEAQLSLASGGQLRHPHCAEHAGFRRASNRSAITRHRSCPACHGPGMGGSRRWRPGRPVTDRSDLAPTLPTTRAAARCSDRTPATTSRPSHIGPSPSGRSARSRWSTEVNVTCLMPIRCALASTLSAGTSGPAATRDHNEPADSAGNVHDHVTRVRRDRDVLSVPRVRRPQHLAKPRRPRAGAEADCRREPSMGPPRTPSWPGRTQAPAPARRA